MTDEIVDVDTGNKKEEVGLMEEEDDHMNYMMLWDDINAPGNLNFDVFLDMDGPDASLSIGQIEEFLFNDDAHDPPQLLAAADDFFPGILLDSPLPSSTTATASSSDNNLSSSPDIVSLQQCHTPPLSDDPQPQLESANKDSSERQESQQPSPPLSHDSHHHRRQEEEEEEEEEEDGDGDGDDDPIAKKRKRQMRNRDAAVRSRERKKMYVRDLEIKSRYYESECRRLGMLLQFYIAENHALRLSLHNSSQAFGASTTKQESAVLLESLLLGSLLWFLGVVGLLILPRQLLSNLEAAQLENVGGKNQGGLPPREAGSNAVGTLQFQQYFMMSKRCRGSRRKMRCSVVAVC